MKVKIEIKPADGSWQTADKILEKIELWNIYSSHDVEVNVTGVEFLEGDDNEE